MRIQESRVRSSLNSRRSNASTIHETPRNNHEQVLGAYSLVSWMDLTPICQPLKLALPVHPSFCLFRSSHLNLSRNSREPKLPRRQEFLTQNLNQSYSVLMRASWVQLAWYFERITPTFSGTARRRQHADFRLLTPDS